MHSKRMLSTLFTEYCILYTRLVKIVDYKDRATTVVLIIQQVVTIFK